MALAKLFGLLTCGGRKSQASVDLPQLAPEPPVHPHGRAQAAVTSRHPHSFSHAPLPSGAPDLSRMSMSSETAAANSEIARISRANSMAAMSHDQTPDVLALDGDADGDGRNSSVRGTVGSRSDHGSGQASVGNVSKRSRTNKAGRPMGGPGHDDPWD
ncbi:hypothetical protein FOA52_005294 [Chlamydomonas sp. UWO 241]|nr:hypothetical protein FOA52_005294 [Chlamydomonas sp. UWO 241]